MAVIRPMEDDPRIAKIYLTASGLIVAVSRGFTAMTGYQYADVAGKQADVVFPNASEWQTLVADAAAAGWQDSIKGQLTCRSTFAEDFSIDVSTERGGTDDVRLVVLKCRRIDEAKPMLVVSGASGKVVSSNVVCDNFFGYSSVQMRRLALSDLLPEPYGAFHEHWAKEGLPRQMATAPCLSDRPIELKHQNGSVLWARLSVSRRPQSEDPSEMVIMLRPMSSTDSRARCVMTLSVDRSGTITGSNAVEAAFGHAASAIKGIKLDQLLSMAPGTPLPELIQHWRSSKGAKHIRVSVKTPRGQLSAASMDVELDKQDKGNVLVTLSRLDAIRVAVEVDKNVVVVGAKGPVSQASSPPLRDDLAPRPSLLASMRFQRQ